VVIVGTPGLTSVNDAHGLDFGDTVLIEMARRLASVLRTGDHVARITNVQFAMIVNHLDDRDPAGDLAEVAERVSLVLDTPFVMDGASTRVSTTVRSGCSADGETAQSLLARVMSTDMATT
jgi:diguanylate cyclase